MNEAFRHKGYVLLIFGVFVITSPGLQNFKLDASSDALVLEGDDDFNPTLAAMETEIKPKVLKTVSLLTKEYNLSLIHI